VARRSLPSQEDLELTRGPEFVPAPVDDARLVDLDSEQESPFLRAQKRVPVRRGSLPRKTARKLKWVVLAACLTAVGLFASGAVYAYGVHSWRFTIDSGDDIEITGNTHVTRPQIMDVLGGDIGRNIFFVPLAERRRALEEIPWIESATVMRFMPNHLRVDIRERTPVAFARVGAHISLIDANGVVMDLPATVKRRFSFPVITGMGEAEPLSTRAARMHIYSQVVRELDAGGGNYSQDLSEVDLSDPEDVKATVNDPSGAVLVHLGDANFLDRFKIYISHVAEWRQQFQKLESVDLRYDRQIIVNPDARSAPEQPLTANAVKAALAAGVKPTALTSADLKRAPAAAAPRVAAPAKLKAKASAARPKPKARRAAKKTRSRTRAARHHKPAANNQDSD
jgi:cell division protein FtsQ